MKNKLRRILLVDDSAADNFYHKRVIEKAEVTEDIIIKLNGKEAIDYLVTALEDASFPQPELVFLDINMPVMNGWEFLEAYEKLEINQRADIVVTMLTTSSSLRDREKASKNGVLNGYEEKPLTVEMVQRIVKENFPDRF